MPEAGPGRTGLQTTRTKVHRNPALPDRVAFLPTADPLAPARAFEAGLIGVFDTPPPAVFGDAEFARRIPVLPDDHDFAVKKAKLDRMKPGKGLPDRLFPGDPAAQARLQAHTKAVTDAVREFVRLTYPFYRLTGYEKHTLRVTETFPEGMHLDCYGDLPIGPDDVLLRVFVNFDKVPRIWRATCRADELFVLAALDPWRSVSLSPDALNDAINRALPLSGLPADTVFFAPGSLWVCDGQLVSHEVVYGRKSWGFSFGVDGNSLLDPALAFPARMRDARADAWQAAAGTEPCTPAPAPK